MKFETINLVVTIILAVGGFICTCLWGLGATVIGWLILRLTRTLDKLEVEVNKIWLDMSKRPDHGFVREEASRVTKDGVLDHENRLHRGDK